MQIRTSARTATLAAGGGERAVAASSTSEHRLVPVVHARILPEMDEPGGSQAKAYLVELAEGEMVVCDLTVEITHGRRVGTGTVGARIWPNRLSPPA